MARALIPSLIAAVREQHRDMSVEFTTLSRQVDDSLIRDRVLALLSGFFGALALLVAGLGLYGVLSLAVARRRRELGVRMALGAPPASLRALALRDVLVVALVGIASGAVAALLAGRVVRSQLFDLEPTDPGTWLLALATLSTVAALAGYVPARRAARIDPVVALREE